MHTFFLLLGLYLPHTFILCPFLSGKKKKTSFRPRRLAMINVVPYREEIILLHSNRQVNWIVFFCDWRENLKNVTFFPPEGSKNDQQLSSLFLIFRVSWEKKIQIQFCSYRKHKLHPNRLLSSSTWNQVWNWITDIETEGAVAGICFSLLNKKKVQMTLLSEVSS